MYIRRRNAGRPGVMQPGWPETAKRLGIKKLFVSISNTAVYASAYAVGEGDVG